MSTLVSEPIRTVPSVADVLERAAWYVEEFGHCKKAFAQDENGLCIPPWHENAVAFCAAGAVSRALMDLGFTACAWGDCGTDLLWELGDTVWSEDAAGIDWNDEPARTPEEVVCFLREQAVRARETESEA